MGMTAADAAAAAPGAVRTPGRTVRVERPRRGLVLRLVRRAVRQGCWLYWRYRFAQFGRYSTIAYPHRIHGHRGIRIGQRVSIWPNARLEAFNTGNGDTRIVIGDGCAIQPHVHIGAAESVRIGRGVLMASYVYITDHDHDWTDPENPVISNDRLIVAPVTIGDFVWLGERVMVLKGVTIGDRSIIGAGSIVTKDIPAYTLAVGAPARVIRIYDRVRRVWVHV